MDIVTVIGCFAAVLTTLAFVPQVLQTLRTRATADISLSMFAMFTTGVGAWLTYGVMIHSAPIIVANFITLMLAGTILVLKVRNG
jgi:MtN3 and saliva related transmembrane protein